MSLLLVIAIAIVAFLGNFLSWYLAGRRIHYVQRLEAFRAMRVALVEDLLPFVNIGGVLLVPTLPEKVFVAVSAALGGALGVGLAIMVEKIRRQSNEQNPVNQP